jgi:hypothetical protein
MPRNSRRYLKIGSFSRCPLWEAGPLGDLQARGIENHGPRYWPPTDLQGQGTEGRRTALKIALLSSAILVSRRLSFPGEHLVQRGRVENAIAPGLKLFGT